ncbi:MAG: EAL domain-containing protein [Rhodanobacteraceae bacterium]|nr:EAL domain-containing protein [Rhodanobacteraceae bacterium]
MMRIGLRAKFTLSLLATTLVWVAVLTFGWISASRAIDEVLQQGADSLREQGRSALADRGVQLASFLADALTNPVYYTDLLTVREVARSALEQPDVDYVLVYDGQGRLIHDGSRDIPRFGQVMDDPFAQAAIAAGTPLIQWSEERIDASAPMAIGDLRLGGVRVGLSLARTESILATETAGARERFRRAFSGPAHVLGLGSLILLLWIVVAGWLVARGLVRPIRDLAARAREIERGRFETVGASRRRDELGELMRAFGRMSDAVGRHHHDIRKLAYHDSLTGLPNRLMFRELLDEAIAEFRGSGQGLALLFIDLDDFKRINDTLGHDAGDDVLIEFAARLKRALSASDASSKPLFARLGGDEFVALVSGDDGRSKGELAALSLLEQLKQPFVIGDKSLLVGASIGITVFPDDAHTSKLLLKHGDLAMYQAKQRGKSCYRFFAGHLTEAAEERLGLEHDLREALELGQLAVAYQPIHDLQTGRLVGAEALLRWRHARRGMVPPSIFVPIAEASGLIDTLGEWVLDRACRDTASWQHALPGLTVAVNLSARQLQRSDLGDRVRATLERHRLNPELLHLELTESSLLHDEQVAFAALGQLRATGVRVWLDDFGTGFSGLSHLRRARVDGVKIDRSFITDILTDPEDLALASAIIAMAHSLGMQVIAEGVETEAQFALLRTRGCDQAQGFWMSAAVTPEELIQRPRRVELSPEHLV